MSTPPDRVLTAQAVARTCGFEYSCDDRVGQLLAALAAAVPAHGRILELGTGVGVGTAWLVQGLGGRGDVELVTVELDPGRAALARHHRWPGYVDFVSGDAVALLPTLGQFDLIFADAPGGKWEGLELTIAALRPSGVLVVDDMEPQLQWTDEQAGRQEDVRRTLLDHPALTSCELTWASGVMLSAKGPGAEA